MSKPERTSGFFSFASISPIGRIMNGGMAMSLTAIAFFSFAGIGDRMPARDPIVLGHQELIVGNWPGKKSAGLPTLGDETARGERPLRIASYNVHKYTGLDFRRDPERIAAVIRSLDADIVSLQEVLSGPGAAPSSQLRILAEKTGMHMAVAGPTMRKADGQYGNALLSRFPITKARLHDISLGGFEPRGIIEADIRVGDQTVRVLATHFGLRPMERIRQAMRLLEILPENPARPLIVMGDMNCWVPGSPVLRRLQERLGKPATMPSYPAPFPLLPLDRIWIQAAGYRLVVEAPRSRLARIASDHLPMVAIIVFAGKPQAASLAEGF
jgi:endonuclease/exonuclease/phosphatase family metal-dependent hydrolase